METPITEAPSLSFATSLGQQRLLLRQQGGKIDAGFNYPCWLPVDELDYLRAKQTMNRLLVQQESLRTGFQWKDGEFIQTVRDQYECEIEDKTDRIYSLSELKQNYVPVHFDPDSFPLFKATLYRTGADTGVLLLDKHLLIGDRLSQATLYNQWRQLYEGQLLDSSPAQYVDFALWQNEFILSEEGKHSQKYWAGWFNNQAEWARIPMDGTVRGEKQRAHSFVQLNGENTARVRQFCEQEDLSIDGLFLSCWYIVIQRLSQQQDVVIACSLPGRSENEATDVMGYFENILPIRKQIKSIETLDEFCHGVDENYRLAQKYQSLPVEVVLERIGENDKIDVEQLFKIGYECTRREAGLIAVFRSFKESDLSLTVYKGDQGFELYLEYNQTLYSTSTIERIQSYLLELISNVSAERNARVDQVSMIPLRERTQLLEEFNSTKADYPAEATLVTLFEQQVEQSPFALAVVCGETLTYRELNERANQLAYYLKEHFSIKPDDAIAVMMERSEWMLISLLGIMKSGAAFLPIDPSYPKERIQYILKDAGSPIVLTDKAFEVDGLPAAINVREQWKDIQLGSNENPTAVNTPSHLAYVIYTSGSTGQPKGVMIEHGSIVNYTWWARNYYFKAGRANMPLFTALTFDLTLTSVFCPLLSGSTVFVYPSLEADQALEWIFTGGQPIDAVKLTPSHISMLAYLDISSTQIGNVITGGEALTEKQVQLLHELNSSMAVYNEYGPTETTIGCSICIQEPGKEITIGAGVANTELYILGENRELLPLGAVGEIYIGGHGLARGYLNREELTKQKFIDHPFMPGRRLYRSGDLGRWRPDGQIMLVGRNDSQVKYHGHRIELGELESLLRQYPGVSNSVVELRQQGDQPVLVAYYVARQQIEVAELKAFLQKFISISILPTHYVYLKKLPLTLNGKVDRKSLPSPGAQKSNKQSRPARSGQQARMVQIWEQVLDRCPIGIDDNFFELGGHSLKAVKVLSRLHKELNVKVELRDLFAHPTVESLCKVLQTRRPDEFASIKPVESAESYPVSHAQKRLWVLHQFPQARSAYNIPGVFWLRGQLQVEALKGALADLVDRHESLRTVFEMKQSELRQIIVPTAQFPFQMETVEVNSVTDSTSIDTLVEESTGKEFDLGQGPLLSVRLITFGDSRSEYVFILSMHHIISDGWSMRVMMDELLEFYCSRSQGRPVDLPTHSVQYKEYAAWQNQYLISETGNSHRKYWLDYFSGELPVLELPTDHARPAQKTYNGATLDLALEKTLRDSLVLLSRRHGASLFMTLLAAVKGLFYRYTNNEDIIVGTVVAGRTHHDLEKSIGFFVNTLALRTQVSGNDSFSALLEKVKQTTLAGFEHESYPFDRLVDDLNLERDASRSPLFEVMLVMQETSTDADWSLPGVTVSSYEPADRQELSKFDLTIHCSDDPGGLHISFEYNTDLFDRDRIERLSGHLGEWLTSVAKSPDARLRDLAYIPSLERQTLLEGFNSTEVDYPTDETIVSLFERQAESTPDALAVVHKQSLTYRQLNELSNQTAHYIKQRFDVRRDQVIGLMVDRSDWMVVAMLGILKAGCAYVPIDPSYPKGRIQYMVESLDVSVLIIGENISLDDLKTNANVVALTNELIKNSAKTNPARLYEKDQLIYVLFTSGSTGQPKGAMVKEQSFLNLLRWYTRELNLTAGDKNLLIAPISFDLAQKNIFCQFLVGGCLYIMPSGVYDYGVMSELISKHGITVINCAPAAFYPLLKYTEDENYQKIRSLRYVVLGGEVISKTRLRKWIQSEDCIATVVNSYGPTECTDVVASYMVRREEFGSDLEIPIGHPVDNAKLYILDKHLNVLPVGNPGQIFIGGVCLGRGYYNHEQLTKEKFVINPGDPKGTLYSTGDLGKWLPNGEIVFLGRGDHQVKIRGFRVELPEIENTLSKYFNVKSALVLVDERSGREKELRAFVMVTGPVDSHELMSFARTRLPEFMVPVTITCLETFPLSPNGKVDRKALLALQAADVAPRNTSGNSEEKRILKLWNDILGHSSLDTASNFFTVGGDSLKLIELHRVLQKEFNRSIKITDLFVNPTIELQAKVVSK